MGDRTATEATNGRPKTAKSAQTPAKREKSACLSSLSTKTCFFCSGFLVGVLLSVLFLAAFQNGGQSARKPLRSAQKGRSLDVSSGGTSGAPNSRTPVTAVTQSPTASPPDVSTVSEAAANESTRREEWSPEGVTDGSTAASAPPNTTYWTTDVSTRATEVTTTQSSFETLNETQEVLKTTESTESSAKEVFTETTTLWTTEEPLFATNVSSEDVFVANVSTIGTSVEKKATETTTFEEVMTGNTTTTALPPPSTTLWTNSSEEVMTGNVSTLTTVFPLSLNSSETSEEVFLGNVSTIKTLVATETTTAPLESNTTAKNWTLSAENATTVETTAKENATTEESCLSSHFLCPNESHCLPLERICDGFVDCFVDAFDEHNCSESDCGLNFRCGAANDTTQVQCVSRRALCDGIWDCGDGRDESGCGTGRECPAGEFLCRDGSRCIKGKEACDGFTHCADHSDEIGCVNREQCETSGKFFCSDGLCLDRGLRCDARNDCADAEDELGCHNESACADGFLCANGACVDGWRACDGRDDCGDWSDEFSCVKSDAKGVPLFRRNDTWSPLCVREFGSRDADAICRQFGLSKADNWTLVSGVRPKSGFWARIDGKDVALEDSCASNQTVSVFCQHFRCGESAQNESSSVPDSVRVSDTRGRECWAQSVASEWLLLSAQCFRTLSQNLSEILIENKTGIARQAFSHFRFSHFRSLRVPQYDVAFVRSEQPFASASVACLPSHSMDASITCFAADDTPFQVLETRVCNETRHLNGALSTSHFCAQRNGQRAGAGRCALRGRPLMCLSADSAWYLSGFSSFEYGCNGTAFGGYEYTSHPTVFSNVFAVKAMVEKAIGFADYRSLVADVWTQEMTSQAISLLANDSLIVS